MAFANVSVGDTFFTWLTRVNQQLAWSNALDAANVLNLISNSAPLVVNGSQAKFGTTYITITPSQVITDNSAINLSSSNVTSQIYNYAQSVWNGANSQISIVYGQANTAYNQANAAYVDANTALTTAQGAFAGANAAATTASVTSVSGTAQGAFAEANSAYALANSANITAQAAYAQANTLGSATQNGATIWATGSQFKANNVGRVAEISGIWAAAAEANTGAGISGNVAFDMSTTLNDSLILGGNILLKNPTNFKSGVSGSRRFTQPAGGGASMTYENNYVFPNKLTANLSSTAGATDVLFYYTFIDANTNPRVLVTLVKNIG